MSLNNNVLHDENEAQPTQQNKDPPPISYDDNDLLNCNNDINNGGEHLQNQNDNSQLVDDSSAIFCTITSAYSLSDSQTSLVEILDEEEEGSQTTRKRPLDDEDTTEPVVKDKDVGNDEEIEFSVPNISRKKVRIQAENNKDHEIIALCPPVLNLNIKANPLAEVQDEEEEEMQSKVIPSPPLDLDRIHRSLRDRHTPQSFLTLAQFCIFCPASFKRDEGLFLCTHDFLLN
jgi:hypothetical protein